MHYRDPAYTMHIAFDEPQKEGINRTSKKAIEIEPSLGDMNRKERRRLEAELRKAGVFQKLKGKTNGSPRKA